MLNPSICTRECDRRCKNEKCLNNCTKHAANISEVTCQDKSFNNTTINIISPKHIYHLFFVLLLLPTVVIIVYKYCMTVELIFLELICEHLCILHLTRKKPKIDKNLQVLSII